MGNDHIKSIVGVGDDAVLAIDMDLKDFAARLKDGTYHLDKNNNGADTLTYANQTYTLTNIDSLKFRGNKEIYLDERNNVPIRVTNGIISVGNGQEDASTESQHRQGC